MSLALAACGGGGGDGGGNSTPPPPSGWVQGVFAPSSDFDAECIAPRSGIDPATNRPYADVAGTRTDQNNWLRSWTHELYLWYSEVPDQNPALFATADYFDTLKTPATTPSGNEKDRFHFTFPTSEWFALSQQGISAGYGAQFVILAGRPPRRVVVAYTEPNSPATAPAVNLARGTDVLTVDGVDLVNANDQASINTLNAGMFPSDVNQVHTFTVRDLGAGSTRLISMTSTNVTSAPVQNVTTFSTATGVVGYMLFNDHIATAESALIAAVNTLQAASVGDLVLDIRYNGGGFLDIASEFAYMIAGPGPTTGQTFERLVFSDKHPTRNPVTGQNLTPVGFHSTSRGFGGGQSGVALPTLNLSRVFVLTGPGTCSASESIMNSLRGVNVQVIQIGSTTCGKPYGFYAFDNCGTTYFSIQFKGVNARDFGDYADGFSPMNSLGTPGTLVPGCSIGDDFAHALGDQAEARLSQALNYRNTGTCSVPPSGFSAKTSAGSLAAVDGELVKSPWLENRILTR